MSEFYTLAKIGLGDRALVFMLGFFHVFISDFKTKNFFLSKGIATYLIAEFNYKIPF
jgi:hypothetical protein